MSNKSKLLLLLILALGVAFAYWALFVRSGSVAPYKSSATTVGVYGVSQQRIPEVITTLGSLQAKKTTTVSSEVSGRIAKLYIRSGMNVKQDQLLVQLDDSQTRAAIEAAYSNLGLSKEQFTQAATLAKTGDISAADLATARNKYEDAQADLKGLQTKLKQEAIRAPFDGIMGDTKLTVGQYVTAGQALFPLVGRNTLQVEFTVPEKYYPELKLGQRVEVKSTAVPNKIFPGKVTFIAPNAEKMTGTVLEHATLESTKGELAPGLFVHVSQVLTAKGKSSVIPEKCLVPTLNGQTVFLYLKGKAEKTNVTVGSRYDGKTQVLTGLKPTDNVICDGQQKIKDGSAVKAEFKISQ